MILSALVDQFRQRFQYEKRAQVCLWFDERGEFTRLLPALEAHLAALAPPPFSLLAYDAEAGRGQVWLKHEVHRLVEAAPPEERSSLRFVLYLPVSEDRLEQPGPDGSAPLDLLAEYRVGGITWRIDGKRPTLFTFLRQAGVALPDAPSDQRRLYDGGGESLLAKYVAKHVDCPSAFWATTLTPALVQERLLGDVDQAILDIAMEPKAGRLRLRDMGLEAEFVDLVRERYGYEAPLTAPTEWVQGLVAAVALCETYLGYHEPADFPFLDRLPPAPLRQHHVALLGRWLRDAEARDAWDRVVDQVEERIDLAAWTDGHDGMSYGFPHLVRRRWADVRQRFEEAAPKQSTTREFFEHHQELIAKEAEYAMASRRPIGAWALLDDVRRFLGACDTAKTRAELASDRAELVGVYTGAALAVDWRHIRLRREAEVQELPAVATVVDRAHATYTNALNTRFIQMAVSDGTLEVPGVDAVTAHLHDTLWSVMGRRAVIIVDALRYDAACALEEVLRESEISVDLVMAPVPTVTPMGMTAVLPLAERDVTLEVKNDTIHPRVGGVDMSVRENRLQYLRSFGADCRAIDELESAGEPPSDLGDLLVAFGHDDVDHIGHGDGAKLIRHIQVELDRLVRLVRRLHRWGYPEVHLVTDHGFVLLDESHLPEEVPCDPAWCLMRKERFALVPAQADVPLPTFPLPWSDDMRVAVPPGLAFFRAEKSFSHGGASVQELVTPHVVSRTRDATQKRIGVEVVLPTFELTRTAVKVILRPRPLVEGAGQMALLGETGRTLAIDVLRTDATGARSSVLAEGRPTELLLGPDKPEQSITLFFHSAATFRKGELLDLDIRDAQTTEQFPPGGIKLTIGRDM